MDNLSSHKDLGVRELIGAADAALYYLASDTPDFNLVENAFSKPKPLLRNAAIRAVENS
jgi:transposase